MAVRNGTQAIGDIAKRTPTCARWSSIPKRPKGVAKGDKALVGNTGYRRYLKTIGRPTRLGHGLCASHSADRDSAEL